MNASVKRGLLALLMIGCVSPAANAAWTWPYKDNARNAKHPGTTVHAAVQHAVHPIGKPLRIVKPLGSAHAPPKTILAKRP